MQPFRKLLKSGERFEWSPELEDIFRESKEVIVQEIERGVRIFDKTKPTCIATDWSKEGIGFWLFQKHCRCTPIRPFCCTDGWKITLVGSRFTHAAESRYAPIEGEALAVADALDKARYFMLGCEDLIVVVDHKPLLKLLADRALDDIPNPRLRNLKEKTLRYRFRIIHIPGMRNKAADAMSRRPVGTTRPSLMDLPDDNAAVVTHLPPSTHTGVLSLLRQAGPEDGGDAEEDDLAWCAAGLESLRSVTWDRVREATSSDGEMRTLEAMAADGIPDSKFKMPETIRDFHQYRESITSTDGVVLYKDRVVIPPSLRGEVLSALHAAHQGVSMMTARAESSVFWPGMSADISATRRNCEHCHRMAPSQPGAPPTPPIPAVYPFQAVCSDFFVHRGVHYLVTVDRYSNWPIISKSTDGAAGLINHLRRAFLTYGTPEELTSDGGPEFTSTETRSFLHRWGVHHRLSSVAFPHSNCRMEIGVKTMKRLITDNTGPKGELDTDAVQRAILQYRNTPDPDTKISPAMCVFGRPIRDFIPIVPGKYRPHETWRETLTAREEALRKRHIRTADTWAEHTKCLPPLVIDGSGRITLRNRRFLRKFSPVRSDLPPPRSATHVTVPALVVTPRLPDLVCDPVMPVARTGPTLPPVLTSVSPPRRGSPPASVTPAAPGLDTPRRVILRASPPARGPGGCSPAGARHVAPCAGGGPAPIYQGGRRACLAQRLFRGVVIRPRVKVIKPVPKQVRVWPEGASSALQDCFDTTDWEMFKQAATYNNHTDIEEYTDTVTSYISKCIDDVTHTKTIITRANRKPCLVHRLLRARDNAFRAGDETGLRAARANLSRGIRKAKQEYTHKITCHFKDSRDTRSLWQGIQTITDYKPVPQLCDSNISLLNNLNSFFARFEAQNNTHPQKTPPPPHDQALCLSAASVKRTLSTINTRKATVDQLGLNTSLCNWLLDFLSERPQAVRVGNNTSSSITLSTGAPQGCVLSPLLFTLLTHDCKTNYSTNHMVKFADDTTLVGLITKDDETHYRKEVDLLTT
ncbi:hypothetical protein SKAU_G00394250 [Synaphobranchus kaupii]|uniref:Gypsy retrotransposon integrase-like protein 1 n=1 Tax=Synaphobranchus kaupii TaxID=118154 RepID=A0A9Q1EC62_SYNKA|nr:hypothetical protein SKAU_G00394250 [Synaphobranchus kaupii]